MHGPCAACLENMGGGVSRRVVDLATHVLGYTTTPGPAERDQLSNCKKQGRFAESAGCLVNTGGSTSLQGFSIPLTCGGSFGGGKKEKKKIFCFALCVFVCVLCCCFF